MNISPQNQKKAYKIIIIIIIIVVVVTIFKSI